MALFPHFFIGLAAKGIAPKIHVGWLILASSFIDGMSYVLVIPFLSLPYDAAMEKTVPFTHSLLMAAVWSLVAVLITWFISHKRRDCMVIGLLVFGHWVVDFISWPMMGKYLPVLFEGSPMIGLDIGISFVDGLMLGGIIDFLYLPAGLLVYFLVVKRIRKARSPSPRAPNMASFGVVDKSHQAS